MNLKPVMNPKSVIWGSISFNGVKSISLRQNGEVIRDYSDTDTYESVVALSKIGTELIIQGNNIHQQIGATEIGKEEELRFTLDAARSTDEPITFIAPNAVLIDKKFEGGHGSLAGCALRFVLRSSDGSTAPIGVS